MSKQLRYLMRLERIAFLAVVTMLFLVSGTRSVQAHRVNVFAWVEGDTIHVESKFPGGRKVQGGEIVVLDKEGNELLKGVTDEQGNFSFKVPQRTDLKIVLKAGMGHQAEWTIPADEIQEAMGESEDQITEKSAETTGEVAPEVVQETEVKSPAQGAATITAKEIQQIVEASLDRKLDSIKRMLAESRETGATVRDVVGGIGYIFGLLGVAAYFSSRRKR